MTVQNHMIRSSTTKNRDSNMKRSNTTTSTTQEFYITTVGEWNQWNVKCFQIILNPVCIEILPCWMDRKIVTYLCFLYIAVHPIHAYHCSPWQVPFRNNALWWWLIWVSLKIAYPQRKSMVYQQFSYEYSHVDPFSEVYPIFRPTHLDASRPKFHTESSDRCSSKVQQDLARKVAGFQTSAASVWLQLMLFVA
jgi:hypothetical protein